LTEQLAAPCGTGALYFEKRADAGIVKALIMDPAHAAGNDAPLRLQFEERQNGVPVVGVNDEIWRTRAVNFDGPGIVIVRPIANRLRCPVAARLD